MPSLTAVGKPAGKLANSRLIAPSSMAPSSSKTLRPSRSAKPAGTAVCRNDGGDFVVADRRGIDHQMASPALGGASKMGAEAPHSVDFVVGGEVFDLQ